MQRETMVSSTGCSWAKTARESSSTLESNAIRTRSWRAETPVMTNAGPRYKRVYEEILNKLDAETTRRKGRTVGGRILAESEFVMREVSKYAHVATALVFRKENT